MKVTPTNPYPNISCNVYNMKIPRETCLLECVAWYHLYLGSFPTTKVGMHVWTDIILQLFRIQGKDLGHFIPKCSSKKNPSPRNRDTYWHAKDKGFPWALWHGKCSRSFKLMNHFHLSSSVHACQFGNEWPSPARPFLNILNFQRLHFIYPHCFVLDKSSSCNGAE